MSSALHPAAATGGVPTPVPNRDGESAGHRAILTRCLRCSLPYARPYLCPFIQPDPKSDQHKGIIPRLVEAIFQGIEDADQGIEFTVKLSYVEIYSERVRDLLTARNSGSDNLKIREGTHGGVYIEGVTETYVNSVEQILALMDDGQRNRAVASTNMNETSSRSHSVFILTLGQLDQNSGSKKGAKLTLVDCECFSLHTHARPQCVRKQLHCGCGSVAERAGGAV